MQNLFNDLKNKYLELLKPAQQNLGNITNNAVVSLGRSPVGQGLVNTQKFIESPKSFQLPQVPNAVNQAIQTKTPLGSIQPIQMVRDIANVPFSYAANTLSDIGQNIGRTIGGRPIAQYQNVKSPATRLGMNVGSAFNPSQTQRFNIQNTPQQIIGNVAGTIEGPLSVYGGEKILGLGKGAAEQAIKQTFLNTVKQSSITGGKITGLYSLLDGLAQGRNDTLTNQLLNGVKQGTIGTVAGTVFGGAMGAGGYAWGKVFNTTLTAVKKVNKSISDKEAVKLVGQYWRNKLGQFAGVAKKPVEWAGMTKYPEGIKITTWQDRVDQELGISGINPQSGFIKPSEFVPKPSSGRESGKIGDMRNKLLEEAKKYPRVEDFVNKYAKNGNEDKLYGIWKNSVKPNNLREEALRYFNDVNGKKWGLRNFIEDYSPAVREARTGKIAGGNVGDFNPITKKITIAKGMTKGESREVIGHETRHSIGNKLSEWLMTLPPSEYNKIARTVDKLPMVTGSSYDKRVFLKDNDELSQALLEHFTYEKTIFDKALPEVSQEIQRYFKLRKEARSVGDLGNFYNQVISGGGVNKGVSSLGKMEQTGQKLLQQVDLATTGIKQPIQSLEKQISVGGGQSGIPTMPSSSPIVDPVQKIINALKQAKSLEQKQASIYAKIKSQQSGAIAGVGKNIPGEQGYFAQLGQLKGEMPKVQFDSLRKQIQQSEIDSLFNTVEQSILTPFEKVTAKSGLAKLLGAEGGSVPVKSELKLLNEVFPPEFMQAVLEKRPFMEKLWSLGENALNLPRAVMATADLSAPLRQGVFLIGRPKQWTSAFRSMFKYAFNEKSYQGLMKDIQTRPTYRLMRENKLALTDMSPMLGSREEAFMSNLSEKIPVFGKIARGSNRAYSGFLNKLRADTFDDLYKNAQKLGVVEERPQVVNDIAKFVNSATGRGDIGSTVNKAAVVLNGAFFSPRLMMSRLNLLNPVYYARLDPFVRKEALKSLFLFAGTGLSVLGMAKLGGASVSADPRNADFGKIKLGDTRYDPWGGFQQYIVLAGRLLTGQMVSSTTGKEFNLGEGYKPTTRFDIIQRFFESKESPIASFATSLLKGQTNMGEKINPPVEIVDRFIPMVVQDMYDLYREDGSSGLFKAIPGVFGVGSQTYTDQIPMAGKTPTGKPNVQWRQAPGFGETILNKITGTQLSNIPQDQWKPLVEARNQETAWKIKLDSIKKTVLSTEQPQTVTNPITGKLLNIFLKDGVITTKDITPKEIKAKTTKVKKVVTAKKPRKISVKAIKLKIPKAKTIKVKAIKAKKIKVYKMSKTKKLSTKTPKVKLV